MMQKRTLTSLLLISFLVAFAFSYSSANEVTFGSPSVLRCDNNVLNIDVNNTVDVLAVEIVFEISGSGGAWMDSYTVDWAAGFTELGTRFLDLSQADGVSPDTIRMAATLIDSSDVILPVGDRTVATVSFSTNASCGGSVSLDGVVFDYPIPATIETQFVDAATTSIVDVTVNAGTVTWTNTAPELAEIPDASIGFGTVFSYMAIGSDNDNCEKLTYSKPVGPASMSVDPNSGQITWVTDGDDVCEHAVEIMVTDSCGLTASRSFTICVFNVAPEFTGITQDQPEWVMGDEVTGNATATDSDNGPVNMFYSLISGPAGTTVDGASGDFSWQTEAFVDAGDYEICIGVTDNANLCDPCSPDNSDEICITIHVAQAIVMIEKEHGTTDNDNDGCLDGVLQGQMAQVSVSMDGNIVMGGFDLLMSYDNSALTFMSASAGAALTDCNWEYFTYRTGPFGNCNGACPTGMLRVVGIAEQNDGGQGHPDYGCTGELFELEFLVSSDITLECQFVPISFYWLDCGDNTISSQYGDTLFVSHSVWAYTANECPDVIPGSYTEIVFDDGVDFPAIDGAPISCMQQSDPGKPTPWQVLDMFNGGIDIICTNVIDDRGDINLDGIAYSIADAVMFANYFVAGMAAFPAGSEAGAVVATDVNADGLTLTVADLVYLIRVVVGDAAPYAPSGYLKVDPMAGTLEMLNGEIGLSDGIEVSGAAVVLAGDVQPELLADNMVMDYAYDGVNTNVIVYASMVEGSEIMESVSGPFLFTGGATIVSLEMAAKDGSPINVDQSSLVPANFNLDQNYPNPFNPSTNLRFSLPEAGDYSIQIYNVTGQLVDQIDGSGNAGAYNIVWDASNLSSGVYFYKLSANGFSATKKMVLLK
ncbi:MAG: T9SS type A sorting domain-containing protein [candidate division Zixibacteria bacterium]